MMRWALMLGVACLVGCVSDGGPGTESPLNTDAGDSGSGGADGAGTGGEAGQDASGGIGGMAGMGGGAGAGGVGGAGGVAGLGGEGGVAGLGGAGGIIDDDDAGAVDEGSCAVACTGIAPDEAAVEECFAITEMPECTDYVTSGFPASCRWVTSETGPCLTP